MKKYLWPGISFVLAVSLFWLLANIRSDQLNARIHQRAFISEEHPIEGVASLMEPQPPQPQLGMNSSQDFKPTSNVAAPANVEIAAPRVASSPGGMSPPGLPGNGRGNGLNLEQHSEIAQLLTALREVTDDSKKAELTKQLDAAIVAIFDKDMTERETDLRKLEDRLTKLRAQLDRRRKAKAEIIQLQLKVMVNEADGLGFSGKSVIEAETGISPATPSPKAEDETSQ